MIQGLVFDFDGLIIDTEMPRYRAFSAIYREYGVELPLDKWVKSIGGGDDGFDPFDFLERGIGRKVDRNELKQRAKDIAIGHIREKKLNPGVLEYLDTGRKMGLKIGLASGSSSAWVTGFLGEHGLTGYFDFICTRDLVVKVKPDPEIYRKVLEKFGMAGNAAIAFEDSPNGALAAKRAGLNCVIVPTELTKHLEFESYDIRLNSLKEMELHELLDMFT